MLGKLARDYLIGRGNDPREAIGSVNAAEFFVTLAGSVTFILTIGLSHYQAIIGLAVGGVMAPVQKREGYDPAFSTAVNVASCPTGLLIPPSTPRRISLPSELPMVRMVDLAMV